MKRDCNGQREEYSPGYGNVIVGTFAQRTAHEEAAFLLDCLSPGMRVLDCGCGPGTITAGLAEIVHPGEVVGVDVNEDQVRRAAAHAKAQGIDNVSFQEANVYTLPFPDDSFDAVFAHAILQHLKEPVKALTEMRRVLVPGGVIGVRDDDAGTLVVSPTSVAMEKVMALLVRMSVFSGGDPYVGRRHRELLRRAGFTKIWAGARAQAHGDRASTLRQGEFSAAALEHMAPRIAEQGWASTERVFELAEACRVWGASADAFDVITWCEAVGYA